MKLCSSHEAEMKSTQYMDIVTRAKSWKENQNSMDLFGQTCSICFWQKIPSKHLKIENILNKSKVFFISLIFFSLKILPRKMDLELPLNYLN